MSRDWQSDYRWQRRLLPAVKRILGEHLIREAPITEDRERNTDLIVLNLRAIRIGCRLRRWEQLDAHPFYGAEFTLREGRPSGTPTELDKLVGGWGDYFFYGFADEVGTDLATWLLGSLHVFRAWYVRQLEASGGSRPGRVRENADGSSWFRVFTVADLPDEFLIARGSVVERELLVLPGGGIAGVR